METFVDALRKAGVPGLHLSMLTVNTRARAFYDKLGFEVLDVPDAGELTYLGLRV
jgi:ribosomal protein S18 acetylase RimI-like enzyme